MAMIGFYVILAEIILVIVLPYIMKLDPYTSDYAAFFAAPSKAHILGTDAIGRDVFARLIYGGRTSLLVGGLSTVISCAIGVPLGVLALRLSIILTLRTINIFLALFSGLEKLISKLPYIKWKWSSTSAFLYLQYCYIT
jgi:ABC-type dipeptide/oligopeptide/nickel transport system permease subunit